MSYPVLEPELKPSDANLGRWMVLIFNNDQTAMDAVVEILMIATGCDVDEAYTEMWEAHHFGKAPCHFAAREECETAAAIIQTAGVKTEVTPEWAD